MVVRSGLGMCCGVSVIIVMERMNEKKKLETSKDKLSNCSKDWMNGKQEQIQRITCKRKIEEERTKKM